jgi:cytochrome P450
VSTAIQPPVTIDEAMIDPLTPADRGEVVDAIAGQLPARCTCNLLGFPEEDWRQVKGWSEKLVRTGEWTNQRVEDEIDVAANIFAPAVRSFRLGFDAR